MSRWLLPFVALLGVVPLQAAEPPVDFNREVRPILAENCFKCHGPDEAERKAKLRLDDRAAALKREAFVAGSAEKSELVARLLEKNEKKRMPPVASGKTLTPKQIETLTKWIDQGAKYSTHWAFVPPVKPAVPSTGTSNAIDAFIVDRLKKDGLKPSAEADRTTLIRRLTFDLTGLPPTIAEIDEFLNDESANAYEKLVDRLLKSPRYGERMTLDWLDAARYADTHGYHIDSGRDMTRWREWVIDSFNNNKPFDKFTVEQLAGDLLPNSTLEQKIASGFNRNHMINFEGGAIPEEYHTAYIVDRVNTTSTVWLGLSVGCAQCHDHKYDPISQKDFYRMFAFFHNVPEAGLDGSKGNAMPFVKAPSGEQTRRLAEMSKSIADLEKQLAEPMPKVDAAQAKWESEAGKGVVWTPVKPTEFYYPADRIGRYTIEPDGTLQAPIPFTQRMDFAVTIKPGQRVTGIRLDVLPNKNGKKFVGASENGNFVLTRFSASGRTGGSTKQLPFRKATADFEQAGFGVSTTIGDADGKGWAIHPKVSEPHWAIFELTDPLNPGENQSISLGLAFHSIFDKHVFTRFKISVTDAANPHASALTAEVSSALSVPTAKRTPAQAAAIRSYYRQNVSPDCRELTAKIDALKKERTTYEASVPTAMVMQEMPKPRDTFVLIRGAYDKKGEKVAADIPEFLKTRAEKRLVSPSRLDLARWLVSAENPLTARVTVNRYWQLFFGTGLVKTAEDFGTQGEFPSHPELLDWLAVQFRESGWDVKALVKMMVMSNTYRQESKVLPEHLAKDPENRLLARASRVRLPAEFIRDQALAVSGLMNGEIGGKSVFPYQPTGLWEELMSRADGANWTAQKYTPSSGKDLYRRTMYTFWKRTCPPPTLATFDAPDREVCTVRRPRTNTPLQALILMNDPTYVEASRKLAERLLREAKTTEERLTMAFRMYTARMPRAEELAILKRVFEGRLAKYQKDPEAAKKLLKVGESPADNKLSPVELAAWAATASVIMNLDEAVTRG